jgi:hypothetical protein
MVPTFKEKISKAGELICVCLVLISKIFSTSPTLLKNDSRSILLHVSRAPLHGGSTSQLTQDETVLIKMLRSMVDDAPTVRDITTLHPEDMLIARDDLSVMLTLINRLSKDPSRRVF